MMVDELIVKANEGEVESMKKLVDHFIDESDWNEATDWADKAAAAGSLDGAYKAAVLHELRLSTLLNGGMPYWTTIRADAKAARENAGILISLCMNSGLKLDDKEYSAMLDVFRSSLYGEAVACYFDGSDDHETIVRLLKDTDTTREQMLYGLCCFDMKQYNESKRVLSAVYQDNAYFTASMFPAEELVFSIAMLVYSGLVRAEGDLIRAVMILNRALDCIKDEDRKESLRKELAKYKKKMFGGWKYTG